jgi:hypothetical protein
MVLIVTIVVFAALIIGIAKWRENNSYWHPRNRRGVWSDFPHGRSRRW